MEVSAITGENVEKLFLAIGELYILKIFLIKPICVFFVLKFQWLLPTFIRATLQKVHYCLCYKPVCCRFLFELEVHTCKCEGMVFPP